MYKAVFIDLDGTLLRGDHSVSDETKAVLQSLISAGILVVIVSARPFHGITPITSRLGISSMPVVSLNGSYIVLDSEVIFQSLMDLETVAGLHSRAMEFDATLIFYSGLEWYATVNNAAITKEQRITDVKVTVAPFESLLHNWTQQRTGVNKLMVTGEVSMIRELESKLLASYAQALNIYTSNPRFLDIMRREASKTNAIKFFLEKYGIRREEIIAIGDNFNDKEMISFAGTGVAMGNAPDEIKAVADYVTDTNEQDGVRKAIEKFI